MSGCYENRQRVGMDVHRRRSVLVRMSEAGEKLETIRISNDPDRLREVMGRAGEDPEVVLEACYGWYWAADTLAELGATVHLAHPLGVQGFAHRRVKNDERDAPTRGPSHTYCGCRWAPRPGHRIPSGSSPLAQGAAAAPALRPVPSPPIGLTTG